VLFQTKADPLLCFTKLAESAKWWGMMMTSEDQGRLGVLHNDFSGNSWPDKKQTSRATQWRPSLSSSTEDNGCAFISSGLRILARHGKPLNPVRPNNLAERELKLESLGF